MELTKKPSWFNLIPGAVVIVRFTPSARARFFYKIKDDIVWIVAVWHGAQLPREPRH